MTTHTIHHRRPGTAGPYIHRNHTVTGTPAQLANLVENHRTAGTLVAMTPPRRVGDRYQMVIRLREHQPTRPGTRVTSVGDYTRSRVRRSRQGRVAALVTVITVAVGGLVAVAAYLIGQLVEFVTAHAGLIVGVLVLAAVLVAALARGSGRRRHCPGC